MPRRNWSPYLEPPGWTDPGYGEDPYEEAYGERVFELGKEAEHELAVAMRELEKNYSQHQADWGEVSTDVGSPENDNWRRYKEDSPSNWANGYLTLEAPAGTLVPLEGSMVPLPVDVDFIAEIRATAKDNDTVDWEVFWYYPKSSPRPVWEDQELDGREAAKGIIEFLDAAMELGKREVRGSARTPLELISRELRKISRDLR